MTNAEILPCPICEKQPVFSNITRKHGYMVVCADCGVAAESSESSRKAIDDWNRRKVHGYEGKAV